MGAALQRLILCHVDDCGDTHRLPFDAHVQSMPRGAPGEAIINRERSYYADIAVLAYPVIDIGELPVPQVTSNTGAKIDAPKLNDVALPASPVEQALREHQIMEGAVEPCFP